MPELIDVLESGDVDSIVLTGNVQFLAVADESYEDMFLRIGASGALALYRQPNADTEWEDVRSDEVVLTDVEQVLSAITVDQDVSISDSSFSFSCQVDNTTNQNKTILFRAWINGVGSVDTQLVNLSKGQTGALVAFSGAFAQNQLSGSLIEVRASALGVTVRGDIFATKFSITKAAAA